ncbi:hypothetical protein ACWEWX_31575 [Streptomyces asiaticus]
MMDTTLDPSFLKLMDDNGLLITVNAHQCVAGPSEDELTGVPRLLVEHVDEALLHGESAWRLWRTLLDTFPGTFEVMVRSGPGMVLPEPWRRYSTYLVLAEPSSVEKGAVPEPSLAIPARPEHRPYVLQWLVEALREAARVQNRTFDAEAAADTARELLDDPSSASFVVLAGGRPVGHATVLASLHDDATGRDFVELFDVLVDDVEGASRLRAVLVAAAARHAQGLGRPLLGHVVHGGGDDVGAPVVAMLSNRGWDVDHVYWTVPTALLDEVIGA